MVAGGCSPSTRLHIMDIFIPILLSCLATCLLLLRPLRRNPGIKLPPGPRPLPVLGSITALGQQPHRSLARLSQIHGPITLLKLGTPNSVVISSPESARAVLQKHDQALSDRTFPLAVEALNHHNYSVVWLPLGHKWRRLRKICKEKMLSPARLDSSNHLRTEKLQKLIEYIDGCSATGEVVDVGKAAFTTALNLMSASLFSIDVAEFGKESCGEFREIVSGIMEKIGIPNLADYFPVLRRVDPQGILRKSTYYFDKCFAVLEIIDGRMEMKRSGGNQTAWNDMLEALLEFNTEDESGLSLDDIRHLLLDLFVAGSDTTSNTVEWAMTELIRNPEKMQKLRDELKNTLNPVHRQIQESDISKFPYLQAIVKETFRLHPVVPLSVPHKAKEDTEVNGYTIPKDAQILINVWAIGRDPSIWVNPDKFVPERFLNTEIDFRGQHFELLPFGGAGEYALGYPWHTVWFTSRWQL